MMSRTEIVDLLSLIAIHDQRTVGEGDVEAWHSVAAECGWTWQLARRAATDYHLRGGDRPRIRPANITDTIDRVRETIRRTVLHTDLAPPRELADDPRAEIAWRRESLERIKQAALEAWAVGRPLPQLEPPRLEPSRPPSPDVADLIADTFRLPVIPGRRPPRISPEHGAARAAAEAELDAIRSRVTPPEAAPATTDTPEEVDHA